MYGILDAQEYSAITKDIELTNVNRHRSGSGGKSPNNQFIPAHKQENAANKLKLKLVFDTESSLHRCYGGYFTDWVCGGQWTRMLSYLRKLVATCRDNKIEIIFFVDGSQESARRHDWYNQQIVRKDHVTQIYRHINNKSVQPPKLWWQEPTCLRHCLTAALQMLMVQVNVTVVDHNSEIIAYCRHNKVDGLIADHEDFFINSPPFQFYSSNNLKLFSNHLETIQYSVPKLLELLNIDEKKLTLLGSLLGKITQENRK